MAAAHPGKSMSSTMHPPPSPEAPPHTGEWHIEMNRGVYAVYSVILTEGTLFVCLFTSYYFLGNNKDRWAIECPQLPNSTFGRPFWRKSILKCVRSISQIIPATPAEVGTVRLVRPALPTSTTNTPGANSSPATPCPAQPVKSTWGSEPPRLAEAPDRVLLSNGAAAVVLTPAVLAAVVESARVPAVT
jgi:hypothetical protein